MVTPHAAHAAVPRRTTRAATGVIGAVNREWRAVCARAHGDVLAAWAARLPQLQAFEDLDEVARAASRRDDEHEDVLRALLVLAQDGDDLAGRTVVQAMLGNVVRLAWRTRRHAGDDLEESRARALAALWQVIREYKLATRRCRLVDGISLDVLHLLTRPALDDGEHSAGSLSDLADLDPGQLDETNHGLRAVFWTSVGLEHTGLCSDEQLIVLLAWAVREQVLGLSEAQLLLRFYHQQEANPAGQRAAALELGLGYAAARQRASRAVRRLSTAVLDVLTAAETSAA